MGNTKLLAYLSKTLKNVLNTLSDSSVALSYRLFSLIYIFSFNYLGQKNIVSLSSLLPKNIFYKDIIRKDSFFFGGVLQKI